MAKYMHTLNREPAFFDGDQLCFMPPRRASLSGLRDSLSEIRTEQRKSAQFRQRVFGEQNATVDYGYIRFKD